MATIVSSITGSLSALHDRIPLGGPNVKFRIAAFGLVSTLLNACSVGVANDPGAAEGPAAEQSEAIVRGQTEKHLPQVVAARVNGYAGSTWCTGTYFESRMRCFRASSRVLRHRDGSGRRGRHRTARRMCPGRSGRKAYRALRVPQRQRRQRDHPGRPSQCFPKRPARRPTDGVSAG